MLTLHIQNLSFSVWPFMNVVKIWRWVIFSEVLWAVLRPFSAFCRLNPWLPGILHWPSDSCRLNSGFGVGETAIVKVDIFASAWSLCHVWLDCRAVGFFFQFLYEWISRSWSDSVWVFGNCILVFKALWPGSWLRDTVPNLPLASVRRWNRLVNTLFSEVGLLLDFQIGGRLFV